MKKSLLALVALVGTFCLISCDDSFGGGLIVDWAPVILRINAHDAQGNDLLDPAFENNLLDGTTVSFRGDTYNIDRSRLEENTPDDGKTETRAYFTRMYGAILATKEYSAADSYCLMFGEIDGAADMDEDVVITWADGKTNTIHYHCSSHNEKKLSCKRWYALDGKRQDSACIEIKR